MDLYLTLKHLHSGWRYVVLVLLLLAILNALNGWLGKGNYSGSSRKLNLFTLISAHLQFVFGLILYFFSPKVRTDDMGMAMKDAISRYWTVEHAIMMLLAIVLITIGHSKSKKALVGSVKHRNIAIFYILALVIIIVAISMSGLPLLMMS